MGCVCEMQLNPKSSKQLGTLINSKCTNDPLDLDGLLLVCPQFKRDHAGKIRVLCLRLVKISLVLSNEHWVVLQPALRSTRLKLWESSHGPNKSVIRPAVVRELSYT